MDKVTRNLEDDGSKKIITKLALGVAGSLLVYWGLNRLFGGQPEEKEEQSEEKKQTTSQKSNQKSIGNSFSNTINKNNSSISSSTLPPTTTQITTPSDEETLNLSIKLILQKLKFPKSNQDLDIDSLDLIYFQIANVAARRFEEATQINRLERRRVMKFNPNAYINLILEYNTLVEDILEDSQNELVQGLGIKSEDFKEMIINLSQTENFQKVIMMQSDLRQKIKGQIKPQRKVTLNEMKDVLSYQVDIFKNKPKYLSDILEKLKSQHNLNAATLHIVIQDEIYNKFRLEEEDNIPIIASEEFVNDPDINEQLAEIQCENDELIGPDGNQYQHEESNYVDIPN